MRRGLILAVIVTTLSWGLGQLMDKLGVSSLAETPTAAAVLLRQAMALGMLCAWGGLTGKIKDVRRAPRRAWGLLAASGVLGVAVGGVAYYYALGVADISAVAVFTSGYPLVILVLAAMVLNERLSIMKVTGTLRVLGGLAVLMG